MKILVTGATGHLGIALVNKLIQKGIDKSNLILMGHSEKRSDIVMRKFGLKVFVGDISDEVFLSNIFKSNEIDKIVHSAAIKYVSISNKNPIRTIETNVIGSYLIYKLAIKHGINDVVSISTDKAINPSNIYGMTKALMEKMAIDFGFTVVSGVNFFGSSGSVLDVWYSQYKSGQNLTLTDPNCVRYFVTADYVSDLILDSFGKNEVVFCNNVFKINMKNLLDAFLDFFDYENFEITSLLEGEKITEQIPESINVLETEEVILKEMIRKWSEDNLNNY